jgi:sulfatase maturation enzyme AslB (radical SAM superfamily)
MKIVKQTVFLVGLLVMSAASLFARGAWVVPAISTVTANADAILSGTFTMYATTNTATSDFEIANGTITKCNAILVMPQDYSSVTVATNTIVVNTDFDIYICTGVTGSTSYWKKIAAVAP